MEYLLASIRDLDLSLSARQIEQFALYQALLLEWNRRINLTAASTPQEIQRRHFADSLSCTLATGVLTDETLIDVGSGAGFPGIPLKILYPGLKLTLLESVRKKATFLEEVVMALGLEHVQVIAERAESLGHDPLHRQRYDWAVARAVAGLSPLLEYLLPLCRVGGHALAQKGMRYGEELTAAREAMHLLGGEYQLQVPVNLSGQDEAFLIVVKKVKETPANFPRRAGIPVKRPL